jgi:hypothetical protein
MNTILKEDPIYELRLYKVAPGRMRHMQARVQQDLCAIFPRHGIRPLDGWRVVAGPNAPLYIYLTPFRHMQERNDAWAGFYADPAWAECRTRTNDGSELVQRFDILMLRAVSAWTGTPAASGDAAAPLMEMIMQEAAVGQTMAVRAELIEHTLPALRAAGASVDGVFEVISGGAMPAVVLFIGWRDLAQRDLAMTALDERQLALRDAGKPALLERGDQYLMRSVPVAWR